VHKLAIATALAAALIFPTFAFSLTDSETQEVSVTVNKALEGTAGSAVSLSGAPSGSSGTNLDSGQVTAINLRSNAAWTGTISAASATMGENDARESGSLSSALLYGTTATPSSTMPTSATQVSTGSRNADNDAQAYSLYFRQPISWADEAGDYTLTVTHGLSN
jgi:hypothetical protein